METAEKIVDLADELGIRANLLYKWEAKLRGKAAPQGKRRRIDDAPTGSESEQQLLRENAELRNALARRSLEVDFFRGALQKVEAQHRNKSGPGGTGSISKSGT